MADTGERRLGRGLAALIGEMNTETTAVDAARNQRRVPVELLSANPRNPRKQFDDDELQDLARSIKERGIFQPIIVRPDPNDSARYEIIAGERRYRAAQISGLAEVPILIHKVSDKEALEIAIVENVQRSDLNPIEEALGYNQLAEEYSYSQNELSDVIGKSRSHVANTLRLLRLPDTVKTYLADGRLSAGHARTLITASNPEVLAQQIVEGGLSVRNAEALTAKSSGRRPSQSSKPQKEADILALEAQLKSTLGLHVSIDHRGASGEVRIRYKTVDQLDGLVSLLQGSIN